VERKVKGELIKKKTDRKGLGGEVGREDTSDIPEVGLD
jgi:hypothetical protein